MTGIPYLELGQGQGRLHFAHANGYPPAAYMALFDHLKTDFHLHGWHGRPLWPESQPADVRDWRIFRQDMLNFFDQFEPDGAGWIGAGHSLGAHSTLMAALARPNLFSHLILIDPPLFLPWQSWGWSLISRLGLAMRLHPLTKGALRRRSTFSSRQAMYENYRGKRVFQKISDEALGHYVDSLVNESSDEQVTLKFTPAWEAQVYATGMRYDRHIWRALHTLVPTLTLIRPEYHATFSNESVALLKKKLPQAEVITVPESTHLVPLEQPATIADLIRSHAGIA